jgi:hypothetical protein
MTWAVWLGKKCTKRKNELWLGTIDMRTVDELGLVGDHHGVGLGALQPV